MKRLWPLLLIASYAHAAPLDEARSALDNGFPQVALAGIEQQFPVIGSQQSDPEANLLDARALIASGQTEAAANLWKKRCQRVLPGDYWLAQALASSGDWGKASVYYASTAQVPDFEFQKEAIIGSARMLKKPLPDRRGGRPFRILPPHGPSSRLKTMAMMDLAEIRLSQSQASVAREILEPLDVKSASEKSRRALLLGRAADQERNFDLVHRQLADFVPADAEMAVASASLKASALQHLSEKCRGRDPLGGIHRQQSHTARFGKNLCAPRRNLRCFGKSVSKRTPGRSSADSSSSLRQKLATDDLRGSNPGGYLRRPRCLSWRGWQRTRPPTRLRRETLFELAALRIRLNLNNEALAILPPVGATPHTDFLRGLALSRKGEHSEAATAFLSAAANPDLAESALFNAALCQLFRGVLRMPPCSSWRKNFRPAQGFPHFNARGFSFGEKWQPPSSCQP
jgi:hypothetical protein